MGTVLTRNTFPPRTPSRLRRDRGTLHTQNSPRTRNLRRDLQENFQADCVCSPETSGFVQHWSSHGSSSHRQGGQPKSSGVSRGALSSSRDSAPFHGTPHRHQSRTSRPGDLPASPTQGWTRSPPSLRWHTRPRYVHPRVSFATALRSHGSTKYASPERLLSLDTRR